MNDFSSRQEKAVDIAALYTQILIGLAAGIITAVLAFYGNLEALETLNLVGIKWALIFFGLSIGGGFVSLGALIGAIRDSKTNLPPFMLRVMIPTIIQLSFFGLGIAEILYVIP